MLLLHQTQLQWDKMPTSRRSPKFFKVTYVILVIFRPRTQGWHFCQGTTEKNRCFWRQSPIFLNLGWYILGSKWIAFPYHDMYIYHIYIYTWMVWVLFHRKWSQKGVFVCFCDVLFKFPCDLFARGKRLKGSWGCGILGGRAPQAMCRVAIFCISKFWPSKTRKLQSCLGSRNGMRLVTVSSHHPRTQEREVFVCFHMCCATWCPSRFFLEIVYLWEQTGLAGKSPPFNRKYIFIHGGFSRL